MFPASLAEQRSEHAQVSVEFESALAVPVIRPHTLEFGTIRAKVSDSELCLFWPNRDPTTLFGSSESSVGKVWPVRAWEELPGLVVHFRATAGFPAVQETAAA